MNAADEWRVRLADIQTGDEEHDHAAVDDLLVDLLDAITKCTDPRDMRELARLGLEAWKLVPTKWYA